MPSPLAPHPIRVQSCVCCLEKVTVAKKLLMKINNLSKQKHWYLIHAVVNRALPSLHVGSLEITRTVPLIHTSLVCSGQTLLLANAAINYKKRETFWAAHCGKDRLGGRAQRLGGRAPGLELAVSLSYNSLRYSRVTQIVHCLSLVIKFSFWNWIIRCWKQLYKNLIKSLSDFVSHWIPLKNCQRTKQ